MAEQRGLRGLRDNAFVVAAIALPVLVALFFLIATAVPRWTTALPGYDVVVKVQRQDRSGQAAVVIDFEVRDGRVVAVAKPSEPHMYVTHWALLLVDHATLKAREIPFTEPDRLAEGEPQRIIAIPELAAVAVSPAVEAPDGYSLQTRSSSGGPGIVGDIFGMRSYRQRVYLRGNGRSAEVTLPAPFHESYAQVAFIGWVATAGSR